MAAAGRRGRAQISVALGMLVLSVLLWSHVWLTGSPGSTMTCQCGDPAATLWYVAWLPWAIEHAHNPFFTNAVFAGQGGANLLVTGQSLGVALVAWPLTAIFGAVASFNVLLTAVPVINGLSMFVLLRKVTRFLPAQVIGALLYGFSPYVVGQIRFGDFNTDLLFFEPLALWCLYDLLIDRRHRPSRVGAALGALLVAQFFVSPELMALCVPIAVFGALVTLALDRELVWQRRRELLTAFGVAAAIAIVLLAYPAWYLLAGPRHIVGAPWAAIELGGSGWSGLFNPGAYSSTSGFIAFAGYSGASGPGAAYLGIVLLVVLAGSVVFWRRRRLAIVVALSGAVAWLLSIGVRLGEWTPWRLFDQLPVLSKAIPLRFVVLVDLAAAMVLALAMDTAWTRRASIVSALGARVRAPVGRLELAWGTVCTGIAVLALGAMAATYEIPFVIGSQSTPGWFANQAKRVPAHTTMLTLPYPSSLANAMVWQAQDDFRFNLVGGALLVPGRDGRSQTIEKPAGALAILAELSFIAAGPEPAVDDANVGVLRAALNRWGVNEIVVTDQTRDPAYAVRFIAQMVGRPPQRQQGGAWIWALAPAAGSRSSA